MTNERLEQLLIKSMNWIEFDNDDVKNTFEHLGHFVTFCFATVIILVLKF